MSKPDPIRQAVAFRTWTRLLAMPDVRIYVEVDATVPGGIVIRATAPDEQQPADVVTAEQQQDGTVGREAFDTIRGWVDGARFDEELIDLEAQTLRAALAEYDVLAEQLAAVTARAEKAEAERDRLWARLVELGDPAPEYGLQYGVRGPMVLRADESDFYRRQRHAGLRVRDVYRAPWRVAPDAAPEGRSATETDDGASGGAFHGNTSSSPAAGLSELCPCGCPKIGDGCNCRFCNEPYPTQQPSDDTNGADR